ncbi:MAG: DUF922 domain-containing Zn-dependent protease [Bacteroidota bacterium]|nr:DUF922 domain-containing Zn-dependent protease [Bacteroidota bacterium]
MKSFVLTAFMCISTLLANAQESIRWSESQPLNWDDFTGKVNDTSKFDAECFAEIKYNYIFYSLSDFEFEVYANFDKNSSWSRREMQSSSLLKHEQMHFNIAELFAEKLQKDFNSYSYTASTYSLEINQLFDQRKSEYHAMQLQYDEETNHSLNKAKQQEWEEFVTNALRTTRLSLQLVRNNKKETVKGE